MIECNYTSEAFLFLKTWIVTNFSGKEKDFLGEKKLQLQLFHTVFNLSTPFEKKVCDNDYFLSFSGGTLFCPFIALLLLSWEKRREK